MTHALHFICLLLISNVLFCQNNILDYIQLKEDKIYKYVEGEFMSTDTIIDIPNGYYEEAMFALQNPSLSLRQAAIFKHPDSTTVLLGITTTFYDFACTSHTSNFYTINKTGEDIQAIPIDRILPPLQLQDFTRHTKIDSIIIKYLPPVKAAYQQSDMTAAELLKEIYMIHYIMPRKGTTIQATLSICDFLPTNEIAITETDWEIISNDFSTIPLYYNRKKKRFERR